MGCLAEPVREAQAGSIAGLFGIAFLVALAGLLAVAFAPRGMITRLAKRAAESRSTD